MAMGLTIPAVSSVNLFVSYILVSFQSSMKEIVAIRLEDRKMSLSKAPDEVLLEILEHLSEDKGQLCRCALVSASVWSARTYCTTS